MRIPLCILALMISGLMHAQIVPYNTVPDWISTPNGHIATGLGLADINGDGWKDLVVANGNDIQRQNLVVYYNQGDGTFPLNPNWQSADVDYHGHLACGDVDNDGDIDVAVSVYIGPSGFSEPGELKVYYNMGNELESNPSFISDPFYTFSCAMGDADADGDLDIVAVAGEPYGTILDYGKIFLNNNGVFQTTAEWNSDIQMGALDVDFGDFNRDGFLDVIFVCEGTPNEIYLANSQGIIDETPDWQSAEVQNYINSVEVSYTGNQSIVVMTENNQLGGEGRVRKYDFSGTIPSTSIASWYSNPFGYGSGIVLNDVDLDGFHDLIYGGWWLPVKIALGDGAGFEMEPSYTSSTGSVVETIQLSDLDRVDEEQFQETFNMTSGQAGTNVIILPRQVVEGIAGIYRNGLPVNPKTFKHIPGKPWIIFTNPLQPGEEVVVNYLASPYPDMVVTNWDSNKGNYIFYNTESSVGVEEQGGMEAWGHGGMEIWPVPAKDVVKLAVGSRQSMGDLRIDIYDISGVLMKSKPWPEGKNEMSLNIENLAPGVYSAILKENNRVIDTKKLVIIR